MSVRFALLVAALALGACGEGPKPVRDDARAVPSPFEAGALPAGASELPADHPVLPPPDAAPETRVEGEVVLVGELAEREAGFFYVSLRATGSRSTWLTRRYAMGDTLEQEDGTRLLPFELRSSDPDGLTFNFAPSALSAPASDLELHVRMSEEPFVESPIVAEAIVPFDEALTSFQLVLETGE